MSEKPSVWQIDYEAEVDGEWTDTIDQINVVAVRAEEGIAKVKEHLVGKPLKCRDCGEMVQEEGAEPLIVTNIEIEGVVWVTDIDVP